MDVSRSSFYYWKKHLNTPSHRTLSFTRNILLFKEYHIKYPSHGYRWLNAKIKLDIGTVVSDAYAHKCCKAANIKSQSKHYKYRKPGQPYRLYPNLMLSEFTVNGPMQCIVSDMTAFYIDKTYYELTIYMDIWNNEIISHTLSTKRGDRMTYISGLKQLLSIKKQYPNLKTILHSDQGSVYSSKSFNDLLPTYNIIRSMSRAGTPTDNGAMEAINGWIKSELFTDLHIRNKESVKEDIERYIKFFNEERPAYALNYLTPKQFKEQYSQVQK